MWDLLWKHMGMLQSDDFHIHRFYSSSPISWEVKFQQNHEWEHLIMAPLFKFHDERYLKAFWLLFKVPLLKGNAETGTRSTNGEVFQVHAPTLLFPAERDLDKLKEVKEVIKHDRKIVSLPEDLMPDSSLQNPVL